jgi:hypothetical protein
MLGAARGRAGGQAKNCFHNIKDAIVLAKGYGDILDFNADPRFDPAATFNGPQLHTAIQAIGPAGLGLEELPGPVENAPPGSLLITRGNGKNGIDMTNGDAAVIEGDNGKGVVVAYNDGRMELTIDHSWWAPDGRYENMLIAIYKPIARP